MSEELAVDETVRVRMQQPAHHVSAQLLSAADRPHRVCEAAYIGLQWESTGVSGPDRVCELALADLRPHTPQDA